MRIVLIALAVLVLPSVSFAYTAYIHTIRATVYETPSMKSKNIAGLSKGDKIEVKGKKGPWLKVVTGGSFRVEGWTYRFMVGKEPVKNSSKLYSRLKSFFYKIESITKKSRRRPSSYTSTAAARGFREKRRHFAEKYNADYESLEKIESIEITDKEAMHFLWQGVENEKGI